MDASNQVLSEKIDRLTTQVEYLTDQAQITERQRQERAELVRDITPLANQAFDLAVEQLDEVQEYIELGDLLRFVKRLLRNGRNLESMLDQLESLTDLISTLSPLTDEAFGKMVDLMSVLESKGYFRFTQGGIKVLDQLVTSFSSEELESISESVQPITNMLKEITQPDVLRIADQKLVEIKEELKKPVDNSYASLFSQLRDPAVRRGLALTLRVMQVIGA